MGGLLAWQIAMRGGVGNVDGVRALLGMERIDISDDRRVVDHLEAVGRGDAVEIVRDGVLVATIAAPATAPAAAAPRTFDIAALERLHSKYPMPLFETELRRASQRGA